MPRGIEVYSTRADALLVLGKLEAIGPLQYVLTGGFDTPETPVYHSAADIPNLGVTTMPDRTCADRYMVFRPPVEVVRREVAQVEGGVLHFVDPWKNPPCVLYTCGGLFKRRCLIAGLIETGSKDPIALSLFRDFAKLVKKHYFHLKGSLWDCYLGPEAYRLLEGGMRLTVSLYNAGECDPQLAS